MKYPLIVIEGNDLSMYENDEDLRGDIEAIDVSAGVFEAFDSNGVPLNLQVDSTGSVSVSMDGEPPQPERLMEILSRYLGSSRAAELANSSLEELVGLALPLAIEKPKRWRNR